MKPQQLTPQRYPALALAALACALLAACDAGKPTTAAVSPSSASKAPDIIKSQHQAMEKAKQVQGVVDTGEEARRAQVEAAEKQ